jgi:methylated-DNA-[protein]-cysteine S-methyltransferase
MTRIVPSRAGKPRTKETAAKRCANLRVVAFPTTLGWIAAVVSGSAKLLVHQLSFGHATRARALAKLDRALLRSATKSATEPQLESAIEAYVLGSPEPLNALRYVETARSPFAQRVLAACRQIPYGQTRSYAELAARAGSPGAARAVGSVMAQNRLPLLIPCHRVVGSQGKLGGFSAPGGLETKVRLLELEIAATGRAGRSTIRSGRRTVRSSAARRSARTQA